jgi:CubicO group peptidase (beta-lactamase class C family)
LKLIVTILRAEIEYWAILRNKDKPSRSFLVFALICASLSFLLNGCDDGGGISPRLKAQIDNIVECEMLEKLVPGISISVVRNGMFLYRKGYGKADIESDVDVTPETRFAIGSVTKVFTAIGVLNLYDLGLVDLDEKIGAYLPDLPNEEWKLRTVRDLLSMSSGIPELAFCQGGDKDGEVCEDHPQGSPFMYNLCGKDSKCVGANRVPYPEYLKRAAEIPLQFDGGAQYFYSNTNFVILGELIEAVSGESYEDYINGLILGPLGMTDTMPNDVPPPFIDGLAKGYSHNPSDEGGSDCVTLPDPPDNCTSPPPTGVKCKAIPIDELRLPEESFSAGWLVSNQIDFGKLEKALHQMSSRLLTTGTYDLMWSNRKLNNGNFERFGLGWDVCSEKQDEFCPKPIDPEAGGDLTGSIFPDSSGSEGKVVSKDGGVPGYSSEIVRYLDDGLTVIVFSNSLDVGNGPLNFEPANLAAEIALVVRQSGE